MRLILGGFILVAGFITGILNKDDGNADVVARLSTLSVVPAEVAFKNQLPIEITGGHLQGIQAFNYNKTRYYYLTGSSSEFSYYAVVRESQEPSVIMIQRIMEPPFSHAGGFQIFDDLLAVGVEDDQSKKKSRVFIYRIDKPFLPLGEPLSTIDRIGTVRRATAGCVGITVIGENVLVIVGDWDTRHLDFYLLELSKLGSPDQEFILEYSLEINKSDKSNWNDTKLYPYQNINLIPHSESDLYLAATAVDEEGANILDVFRIESSADFSSFALIKVLSKTFPANSVTKFRWGAGLFINEEGNFELLSCGESIREQNLIHIYK